MIAHGFSLEGKTALVAGATGDIGEACCRVIQGLGARVLATGRDSTKLAALEKGAGVGMVLAADLIVASEVDRLAKWTELLDAVVFTCGQLTVKPLRMQTSSEWDGVFGVNVSSAMALTRDLLRSGKVKEGGAFVFVSSVAAVRGAAGFTTYSASKGALNAFTRSLAIELAGRRIRANTVSPGMVVSRMADRTGRLLSGGLDPHWAQYPLGQGAVEDVAWAVGYLISPAARWITGIDLPVDGGWSIR